MCACDDQIRARVTRILNNAIGHVTEGRHVVNQLLGVLDLSGLRPPCSFLQQRVGFRHMLAAYRGEFEGILLILQEAVIDNM
ncbi:hypothetical protein SAMN05216345_11824 [Cupriavidus sp. YR651]|nr:hypothetical protein SAMN05216345_11824 [Cupriavidus sp. YR651]